MLRNTENPQGAGRLPYRRVFLSSAILIGWLSAAPALSAEADPKPVRVLLVADGPTRDFQFVRTLFMREESRKRAEVRVFLQTARPGVVADVLPPLLARFPDFLLPQGNPREKPEDRDYNLWHYDVLVAFDPDWTRLGEQQLRLIQQWVGTRGGGLIIVGGPVHTLQLARPGAERGKLKPLLDVYPVILRDSRLQDLERPATQPWRLNFPGATAEMEFLKLDEEDPDAPPLRAWDHFFLGKQKGAADKAGTPNGFYNYYPVARKKDGATTVATFTDPRAKLADGSEQPYLVIMPYGSGKTVWLGSGETWRLRQYKEAYHERFWTRLARYAGSNSKTGPAPARSFLSVSNSQFVAGGEVEVLAYLVKPDGTPLPLTARPAVRLVSSKDVELKKPALEPVPPAEKWPGWFQGRVRIDEPGEYRLELKPSDGKEPLAETLRVAGVLDDASLQQDRVHRQLLELPHGLLRLAQRLETIDQKETLVQAALLRKAIEHLTRANVELLAGKLADSLRGVAKPSLQDLKQAAAQGKELVEGLRSVRAALGDPPAPAGTEEKATERLQALNQQEEALRQRLEETIERLRSGRKQLEIVSKDLAGPLRADQLRPLFVRVEELERVIGERKTALQDIHPGFRRVIKDMKEGQVPPGMAERLEKYADGPLEGMLKQELAHGQEVLEALRKSLEAGKADVKGAETAGKALDELINRLAKTSSLLQDEASFRRLIVGLRDMETTQRRQTEFLEGLGKKLEADLLKDLLGPNQKPPEKKP